MEEPQTITNVGPVIDIVIGIPIALENSLLDNRLAPPKGIKVKALIDTGSTFSAINSRIVQSLDLHPVGYQRAITANNQIIQCNTYRCCFKIGEISLLEVTTLHTDLEHKDFDCLIGLDILDQGVFVYNGKEKTYSFSI